MANKKFTDFSLTTTINSGDYLVGYNALGTSELRATFQTMQNSLSQEFKYQGTDLKSLSANWEEAYTTVQANSALWAIDSTVDTEVRSLTSNWEEAYTTVQANSADYWDNSLANTYANLNFLPLSGGELTGPLSMTNAELSAGETLTDSLSSLIITINGQKFKIPLLPV